MFLKEQQLSNLGERLNVGKGHMIRKPSLFDQHRELSLKPEQSPPLQATPTLPLLSQGHLSEFLMLPELRSHTNCSSLSGNCIGQQLPAGHTANVQPQAAYPWLEFTAPHPRHYMDFSSCYCELPSTTVLYSACHAERLWRL